MAEAPHQGSSNFARKPPKLAAVALANKTARIAWKLMGTGQSYAINIKPAATVGAV